jgi:hypothetical protein
VTRFIDARALAAELAAISEEQIPQVVAMVALKPTGEPEARIRMQEPAGCSPAGEREGRPVTKREQR